MRDTCYYCHKETATEDFKHPLTFQIKPTCIQCKDKLLNAPSYETKRKLLAKTGCLAVLILIIGIILLILGSYAMGTWGIIISVIIG